MPVSKSASLGAGVNMRAAYKLQARFRDERLAELLKRTCRSHPSPSAGPPERVQRFEYQRRLLRPLWHIAARPAAARLASSAKCQMLGTGLRRLTSGTCPGDKQNRGEGIC
ncbi:leucine zipper domain-containing protein [Stenotrophomonas maltophilia]|uniref:leucine zipper domain-containing protein n=1 Tax=Stenotrophomonas maltophilia TaxID=40324 RepID=UPI003D18797A